MILEKDFSPYLNTSAFYLLQRWNCFTFLTIYGRLPFSHYKKELKKQAFPYGLKTKGQNKTKEAKMIQKGDNIALRPEEANNRSEFGHWEGDLVLGSKKGSKECLLTLVERQTRAFIALKIKDKTNDNE